MAIEPAINCPIDCGVATTPTFARQFSKQTVADRTVDLDLVIEYTPLSSGSSQSDVLGDVNLIRDTYPTSATNVRAIVNFRPEKFGFVESYSSENTSILSNSSEESNLFEYESTGTTSLTVTLGTNEKITKAVTTSTLSESSTKEVFQSFVSGSLGRHIYDQIRQYADGSTSPPNHYPLYSTFDYTNNIYVRNTGSWTYPLDFSGLTVNKSGSGGVTNVTAITPYHAIGAGHYPPEVGDTLYFCDTNNQLVSRTVESRILSMDFDGVVVKFSEPLPSTVKKYKTLPSNFENYLPINRNIYRTDGTIRSLRSSGIPIVVCSHYRWDAEWPLQKPNRYAYFYETGEIINALIGSDIIYYISANVIAYANNSPNYNGDPSNIRGGDSGSPCFFIINNDLVLVSHHATGNAGPFHSYYLSSIQSMINTLGPSGQAYETVDLSGFTNFSS
jgi:hypothetical protein